MKTAIMSRSVITQSRVMLWRWVIYVAVAAAWIVIVAAQFMTRTANASDAVREFPAPSDAATSVESPASEQPEWRAIPVSIIG